MSVEGAPRPPDSRRHDLDALRAFAMLLGIGLHATLSFIPAPWPAQDTRQSELFGLATAIIHGFRMPLFFLISGYFTMMLYRRRGLGPLLRQRCARILLPCLLGLATIVPLMHLASAWAMGRAGAPATEAEESLASAIRRRDRPAIEALLQKDDQLDLPDPTFGITPVAWAAMKGDVESVTRLIDRGAKVNQGNRDGSTALHGAAFLGRHEIAEILIRRGADPSLKNLGGDRAVRATYADWGVTTAILDAIGLERPDRARLEEGRIRVRTRLETLGPADAAPPVLTGMDSIVAGYRDLLGSDAFLIRPFGWNFHLVQTGVFDHLWFLWYLCWLVALFALVAGLAGRPGGDSAQPSTTLATAAMLSLIPLTILPQWFMGTPGVGPDTSTGLLPPPHILAYYGLFFAYGAFSFDSGPRWWDSGRAWMAWLPIGILVLFPMALVTIGQRPWGPVAQVLYTWVMSFGMMGLFRALITTENRTIRYLSDASYWLYVTHLPLVVALQAMVRAWPLPAVVKFLLICAATCGILLLAYHYLVRNTIVGVLLNGRRARDARVVPARPS